LFAFIPFLLMGENNVEQATTAALLKGRESIFLRHLWTTFIADKAAAPFEDWSPYVAAMARPGIASDSSSYYRAVYKSADQVRALVTEKLVIPVLAVAPERKVLEPISKRSFVHFPAIWSTTSSWQVRDICSRRTAIGANRSSSGVLGHKCVKPSSRGKFARTGDTSLD